MKDKLLVIISLCGLLAAAAYLLTGQGGKQGSDLTNFSAQNGKVIVVFGDALNAEQGIETYPSHLAKITGLDVRNMTLAGETTNTALERINAVTEIKPNYVLVTLGAQDLKNQIDLKETLDNLTKVFTTLQANGSAVVYLSVVPPLVGDNWAMAIKDVVRTQGVLWVDDIMAGVWTKPELMSDASNPNAKGHEVIAARLKNVVNF
jgi:lysophospholipase L1-like esterase